MINKLIFLVVLSFMINEMNSACTNGSVTYQKTFYVEYVPDYQLVPGYHVILVVQSKDPLYLSDFNYCSEVGNQYFTLFTESKCVSGSIVNINTVAYKSNNKNLYGKYLSFALNGFGQLFTLTNRIWVAELKTPTGDSDLTLSPFYYSFNYNITFFICPDIATNYGKYLNSLTPTRIFIYSFVNTSGVRKYQSNDLTRCSKAFTEITCEAWTDPVFTRR